MSPTPPAARTRPPPPGPSRSRALGLLLLGLLSSVPAAAQAPAPDPHAHLPVIEAGREAEILALIRPYELGKPIGDSWRIAGVEIEARAVVFRLEGPDEDPVDLRLAHPATAPPTAPRGADFAFIVSSAEAPGARAAVDTLIAAVRANESGAFWPDEAPIPGFDPSAEDVSAWERFTRTTAPGRTLAAVLAVLLDGIVLLVLALVFLLAHLRSVLHGEPRGRLLLLGALIAVGALLRLVLAVEAPMNAWPYSRVVPIAGAVWNGPLLVGFSTLTGSSFLLTELIFDLDFLIACVTPLVFFAHARYVLYDTRAALLATAFLVFLPQHIRFSRSDVEFVQSLATSSLTFVVLYTALRSRSVRWRAACFVLLPLLSLATYYVRPENIFFLAIDFGAILLTAGYRVPTRRRILAAALITAAAAVAFTTHLLVNHRGDLIHGLSLETLSNAVGLFFSVRLNTLINPWMTPPPLTLLAVAGMVVLFRSGQRKRLTYLCFWLFGFFVVHSYVEPSEPAMQARYHFHLITPLLLLAASALPLIESRAPRILRNLLLIYLVAAPVIHLDFIRDTAYNEMEEFAFLQRLRPQIPEGCTVLELSPAFSPDERSPYIPSRMERIGARLSDGEHGVLWRVVNSGLLPPDDPDPDRFEVLSPEAGALIAEPPDCLMVYEGLTCAAVRPQGQELAQVCVDLRERLALSEVDRHDLVARSYDPIKAGRVELGADAWRTQVVKILQDGTPVRLTLYRAHPKPPVAPAPPAP